MTSTNSQYEPLGGKGRSGLTLAIGETYRLYVGQDHLLYVVNQRFSESYRRYYLRDIQALTLRQTAGRSTTNQILGGLWILLTLVSLYVGYAADATSGWIIGGSITGLLGLLCVVNTLKGPTCVCELRTAVSIQELGSLKRVRPAQKILNRLALRISETQGELREEDLAKEPSRFKLRPKVAAVDSLSTLVRKADDGRYHALLFSFLLLDGGVTVLNFFVQHLTVTLAQVVLSLGIILAIVVVLVRQRELEVSLGLKRVMWGILGYLTIALSIGYAFYMSMVVRHPELYQHQGRWVKFLSELSPTDSSFLLVLHTFTLVGSFGLGLAGFILLQRHRKDTRMSAVPAKVAG
jgi:hypothetical protein